jgi:hypothetical protein
MSSPARIRALPALTVLTVVVLASAVTVGTPAEAGRGTAAGTDPPVVVEEIGDDRISPTLLSVAVEGEDHAAAMARYRVTKAQLAQAEQTWATAERALVELEAQEARAASYLTQSARRRDAASLELERLRGEVDELAITSYISGGDNMSGAEEVDWTDATERGERRTMIDLIEEHQLLEIAETIETRDRAAREYDRTELLLASTRQRADETTLVRDTSAAATYAFTGQLAADEIEVADARLTSWVQRADFQYITLDAYWRAALTLALEQPLCGIRWEIIAGISRTEGRHGTWGGARVGPDGRVSKDIIGIALDGTNNTAVVGDSDGGIWDGDGVFDRAVGPMQFLPSSWVIFGADGNGDGEADPQNIYDAALAAGKLLCWSSTGLGGEPGLDAALLQYNHSQEYVEVVSGNIAMYDRLTIIPGG